VSLGQGEGFTSLDALTGALIGVAINTTIQALDLSVVQFLERRTSSIPWI
jgi:hypothetical protein